MVTSGHDALLTRLLDEHGETFAEAAGIDLRDDPEPLWQLLVLCQLLAHRIRSEIAVRAARELFAAGWTTPAAMRASTWQQRVSALGRGGFRRYDFSTATRLGDNARLVLEEYDDDLRRLRETPRRDAGAGAGRDTGGDAGGDAAGVVRALQDFHGIGPTAASVFVREAQGAWTELAPYADRLVADGARAAGLPEDPRALAKLVCPADLPRLCAALVRVARARPAARQAMLSPSAARPR